MIEGMDTAVRCIRCAQRGNEHRCSDGLCPPSDQGFPRLTRVKDPDAALERFWNAGPGSTWEPRR